MKWRQICVITYNFIIPIMILCTFKNIVRNGAHTRELRDAIYGLLDFRIRILREINSVFAAVAEFQYTHPDLPVSVNFREAIDEWMGLRSLIARNAKDCFIALGKPIPEELQLLKKHRAIQQRLLDEHLRDGGDANLSGLVLSYLWSPYDYYKRYLGIYCASVNPDPHDPETLMLDIGEHRYPVQRSTCTRVERILGHLHRTDPMCFVTSTTVDEDQASSSPEEPDYTPVDGGDLNEDSDELD